MPPTTGDNGLQPEECQQQYRTIIEGFSKDANEIIHTKLPAKVMQLQQLLKHAPEFNAATADVVDAIEIEPIHTVTGSPKMKKRKSTTNECVQSETTARTFSILKSNKAIVAPLALLKTQMLDMIELIGTVKISIQLAIPRIEDGNNFGVSIQEETVSELSRAEDGVFSILESMAGYFVARAKVGSKMLKYEQVQDYRMAVRELDSKMYTNLRLFCSDLRNSAALLHDLIIKNLEKIRSPRSTNNQSSMY